MIAEDIELLKEDTKVSVRFKSMLALYSSYMRWAKCGVLFLPTTEKFSLSKIYQLSVILPDEENFEVEAKVVWINPRTLKGSYWQPGFGLGFIDSSESLNLKEMIEEKLSQQDSQQVVPFYMPNFSSFSG